MKVIRTISTLVLLVGVAVSQGWSQDPPAHAFEHVIIHTADGNTIENGTVVWRDGIIKAVGGNVGIPFDAYVIDGGDSLHVYPGFLDGLALWGSPELPEKFEEAERPGEPGYDRAGIQPQRSPADLLQASDSALVEAQKHGFTTAALGLKGFMLPGQLDLFFVNGAETGAYLYKPGIALHAQFDEAPGNFGNGAYPATLMGVMAKLRQLWFDATALKTQESYYAANSDDYPAPKKDKVLESLYPVIDNRQPLYFVVDTEEHIERLFWLKDELGFDVVVVSGKEAYKQAGELNRRNIPVLASIDLPEEPEWKVKEEKAGEGAPETETELEEVTDEMRIFREKQLAAYRADIDNIRKLIEAGVKVGYASSGLELDEIAGHLKTLKEESGLTDARILKILTQNTADILGVGSRLGDLEAGRIASFSVYTKPFAEEDARVRYSVSNGRMTEFEPDRDDSDTDSDEEENEQEN